MVAPSQKATGRPQRAKDPRGTAGSMASTTILLNAFSILGGANLKVVNNGGNQNEGGILVSGGSFVWQSDDIVKM